MPTWKLEIEYEGTRYRGWQMQHNARTIQGELQDAARQLFASKFELFGAGRTDAGVHALHQIAHLKVPELKVNITPRQIQHGFNDVLPHDINILKVTNAPDGFHARHDAVYRQYLYKISRRRNAFAKSLVWWVKDDLDAKAMAEAARLLIGRQDFRSFCESEDGKRQNTSIDVQLAAISIEDDIICFRIGASHFLWKMVRRIVGMLVEVGRGDLTFDAFDRLLKFESNVPAKFTAPPSGLYLEKVEYAR
ncbi:MAG TPA: tRNA pseudouridine(38-40) synthase TruA [Pyrinomonadaceae bacterium]|nr:tRNA pseudouridine(38-40) synthase TruA [Chloracidobacterium sp.]HBE83868.1 tRNA pseudouridine(38-40) synthase TruA [Blastocatellia bacterium]HRJ87343.1 tRNA pseudouridine(38-40) synthase TruA [Pyrinomonadaceae bacterium]HRK51084.1 tRNA pseudouridine(38-40) synthase TruA [Pyrinomonadaceae bacterium]